MGQSISVPLFFNHFLNHHHIMKNENKTITVSKNHMTVNYLDTQKHYTYTLPENDPNREIKLFGKKYKDFKIKTDKKDFLTPIQREIFDDLVYAKHKMTKSEINTLPLMKKYRIKVLSVEVEKTLNRWKQEIVFSKIDSLLLKLFPKSPIVKQLVEIGYEEVKDLYPDKISIHDVVSEMDIAEYLVGKGLFPKFK